MSRTFKPSKPEINTDRFEKPKQIHKESDLMQQHFISQAKLARSMAHGDITPFNPIWINVHPRCQMRVESKEHMQRLLQYYAHSDKVMVVRYHQEGCTACNAIDKHLEYICDKAPDNYTGLHFYDIKKEDHPELVEGLTKFPQVKAFSGGIWADMEFKPPRAFREGVYEEIQMQVRQANEQGAPLSSIEAEEMYFSATGVATYNILHDSIKTFYNKQQIRLHNYWKQVSQRRTWFYRRYIEPAPMPANAPPGYQTASAVGGGGGDGPSLAVPSAEEAATQIST